MGDFLGKAASERALTHTFRMRTTTIGRWAPVLLLGFLLPSLLASGSTALPGAGPASADEDTQSVSVRVESEEGRYLEDTVVTAYRLVDGTWTVERVAETDRDGDVTFYVPVGTYRLMFEPASPDHQARYNGGASTFAGAPQIVLEADDFLNLHVRLPATTWVTGRLLDAGGAPAASNGVYIQKLYGDGLWHSEYDVLTGNDGSYRLGIYDPGFYRVVTAWPGQRSPSAQSAVFEVSSRGQTFSGKDLRMPPGGAITGVVRRPDGTPFHSAQLELVGIVDGRLVTEFGAYAFADANGRYRFEDLAAGTYRVLAEGSSDEFTSVVWPEADRLEDGRDVTVTPGGTARLTDITLRRIPLGRARALDPPTITGEPSVGSVLRAEPGYWGLPVNGEYLDFSYQWFADGRIIPGATGRSYRPTKADVGKPLVVMVTGSGPWAQPGVAFSEPTDPVQVLPTSRARMAAAEPLPPSASGFGEGRLSGQLVDSGGQPVAGALVEAFRAEGRYGGPESVTTAPTDAQGRYELVGLPPGAYHVRFNPTGTQPAFPATSAPAGGTVQIDTENSSRVIDAQLTPVTLIKGRVTLPSGAPAPYAEVEYQRTDIPGGGFWYEHLTDAEGRYTLLVQPGTYRVRFSQPYYDLAPMHWPSAHSAADGEDVVVAAGQAVTGIDAQLVPGARIQGSVRRERTLDPLHVEIAMYQLTSEGWVETRFQTFKFLTDQFGRFDLAGLPPGTYRIGFEPFAYEYVPEFWNDAPDLEDAQDIVVPAGGVVTGKDALIADRYPDYPIRVINAVRPRIKGSAEVGRTLTVTTGAWAPSSVRLSYQWVVGGRPVAGATGRTLRVPRSAVGQRIKVRISASAKYWQPETVTTRATRPVVR